MATPAGIEPATYGLENRCSIQLSYGVVGGQNTAQKLMRPVFRAAEFEIVRI